MLIDGREPMEGMLIDGMLKEGMEMVEEKARFELGMVKPNEVFVQYAQNPR
jgi:hypothetical protein